MASSQAVTQRFIDQQRLLGKAAMHTLFPYDCNFYFLAIELVDSQGNTEDYFSFPILPDEIRHTSAELTNIRKTMGGVNVLKNPTFNPTQISLSGTFGRRFKVLLGQSQVEFAGFNLSIQNGHFKATKPNLLQNPVPQFSTFVKNGYGCIKIIEAIKAKSITLDQYQKPYSLYLYNPILGENFQIELTSFTHFENSGNNNMLPGYSMQVTTVAPLSSLISRKASINSTLKNLTLSNLQKTATSVAHSLRSIS